MAVAVAATCLNGVVILVRKFTTLFLIFVMVFASLNLPMVSANNECAVFLGSWYDVFSYTFNDNAVYDWGTVYKDVSDTPVIQFSKGNNFLYKMPALAGKTYFSFDLMADSIKDFKFSVVTQNSCFDIEKFREVYFVTSDTDVNMFAGEENLCSFLVGQWVKFEVLFDGAKGEFTLIASTKSKEMLRKTFALGSNNVVLSELNFEGNGQIYLDNIKLSRKLVSVVENTVIFADGNYISAFSKVNPNENLYLVQYRGENIINCTVAENTFNSDYLELHIPADFEKGDIFKAFVWNQVLSPVKIHEVVEEKNVITTDIYFDGYISAKDVTVGEKIQFDVSFSDGYTGETALIISNSDGVCKEIMQPSDKVFNYIPESSGEHLVWLYAVKNNMLIPAAKTTFFVAPKLEKSDFFMFPAEQSYFLHNGIKKKYFTSEYVPLINNGHLYLSSGIINNISGIKVEKNTVSYLGEVLLNFDENTGVCKDGTGFVLNMYNGQYSFDDLCSLLGYESEMQSDVLCVSRDCSPDIYDYEDLLFEFVAKKTSAGHYNWCYSDTSGCVLDASTDIHTVYAVPRAFAGFSYKFLLDDYDSYMYEISFDLMYSDDSENLSPFIGMRTDKDGSFHSIIHGTPVTGGKKSEWTRVSSYFTRYTLDTTGFDKVGFFYVGVKPSGEGTPAGSLLFKNVRIRKKSIMNETVESEIVSDKFASWYTLGEVVRFSSKDENTKRFESIRGTVYDIDNNVIYEKTVSARNFLKNGWSWTPEEPGYYEAEFYGIRSDGTENLVVNGYTNKYSGEIVSYILPRHSIAVVKSQAKPMEERCDLLMLSDNAMSEDTMKLADMVGFSGIRIHGVHWGDTVDMKGYHKADGVFDWQYTDEQINNIKKYGFKNVIANIFGTPKWSVTEPAVLNKGYTSTGMYTENCYVPDDMRVVAEGYGAYASRYKDIVDGIEVWNEPSYNNTAFWYQAGKTNEEMYENFTNLTSTAYSAIKAKAPEMTVYSAGFNQANKLFEALLKNETYAESFDAVSCHGRYSDPKVYFDVLSKNEMEDVPVINTEGYFYAYHNKGVAKDYRANNLVFLTHYLEHIKLGTDIITHFSLLTNTEDEWRVHHNAMNCAGIFRKYPYIEPLQGAVAVYNFFDTLGVKVSFRDEYDFGNGIKAVAVNSDDEVNIYIWNANDVDFYLPSELGNCISNQSEFVDLEGKTVSRDDKLTLKRFYCIKNADKNAVNSLISSKNAALNPDFVAPYYTCRDVNGNSVDDFTPINGVFTSGALFNADTFVDSENQAYNDSDALWIPYNNGSCDISSKYALSFDDKGMYLKVVVNENDRCAEALNGDDIVKYDGIRFSIDSYGRLRNTERNEFFAGIVNGQPSLYKYFAADLNEALVEDCSPSGTMLDSKYINIEYNSKETVYKVFVPYSELYPFVFDVESEIRFALGVSDNDNGTLKGSLSFGDGIATDVPQVWKYAKMTVLP